VYGEVGGILRRLDVSFDEETGLGRARLLSVRAMQIIQDPSSAPVSGCPSGDNRAEWEKARREYVLTPQDTAIELSVESEEGGGLDVMRAGVGPGLLLTFTDGSAGTASSTVCWAQWTVVG
jgi:hypothetical protein